MDIAKKIAEELKIQVWQVEAVIKLIDEGNTIPFIARYRKEQHGTLNDEQLRNLEERLTYLRNLEERKQTVLANIEEQGKLTAELRKQIEERGDYGAVVCASGGSVSSLSSKEKDPGYHRQGKGIGRPC